MGDATCRTCPFWAADPPDRQAGLVRECRRNAPRPFLGSAILEDADCASFPVTPAEDWCGEHPLRQRDQLAALAIQGLFARPLNSGCANVAREAYAFADAMLAERAKVKP
jgi:hypothetical protein